MKRIHIGVVVEDVAASQRFYSTLFGADPTFIGEGYARWMLEDPRINFVVSTRGERPGVGHLGIQVESEQELAEVRDRLKAAGHDLLEQEGSTCGYALQNKTWTSDPQGVFWEAFQTLELNESYGEDDFADEEFTALFEQSRRM